MVKVYYRKADLIVSNSKSGKIDIETISNANVTNIPSPSFSSYSKQKSKIKPNFIKIIAVGRLVKEKGYNTIIKALSLLKVKNFSMIILGTGPEETHIKEMIKYHKLEKKVFLKGFKKPKKYFLKSNLFINASLFEGFPNAVVEAINYGLPVICSNCKGGTNEIILNGRGGELFDVNNYIELSKKIIDFNKNPKKYKKKMLLARKNISKFSELSHVSQYERIFKKI